MAHLEGLTAQEADDLEDEWRQLGATHIRRTPEAGGLFTMDADLPTVGAAVVDAAPAVAVAAAPASKTTPSRRAAARKKPKPR